MPQSSFSILSMSDSGTSPRTMTLPMPLRPNPAACRRKGYPNSEEMRTTLDRMSCFVDFVIAAKADLASSLSLLSCPFVSPGSARFASSTTIAGCWDVLRTICRNSSSAFSLSPAAILNASLTELEMGAAAGPTVRLEKPLQLQKKSPKVQE